MDLSRITHADCATYSTRNQTDSGGEDFLLVCYLGLVDVIVSAGIGSTDSHDNEISALHQIVVDWGLELVGVFLDPFAKVDWECDHFFNVCLYKCGWEGKWAMLMLRSDGKNGNGGGWEKLKCGST